MGLITHFRFFLMFWNIFKAWQTASKNFHVTWLVRWITKINFLFDTFHILVGKKIDPLFCEFWDIFCVKQITDSFKKIWLDLFVELPISTFYFCIERKFSSNCFVNSKIFKASVNNISDRLKKIFTWLDLFVELRKEIFFIRFTFFFDENLDQTNLSSVRYFKYESDLKQHQKMFLSGLTCSLNNQKKKILSDLYVSHFWWKKK